MNMKMTKILTALLLVALVLSFAACSKPQTNGGNMATEDNAANAIDDLLAKEASTAEEATALHTQLMDAETAILNENSALWEKVFLSADKGSTMIEDGSNYGDFLLKTIESAKDEFTEDELKLLQKDGETIRSIEVKVAALEEKFPGCGQMPSGGGGPGAGAVGCKDFLKPYLPHSVTLDGVGHIQVRAFAGNFLVVVRALAYLLTLGREGVPEAAQNAVLNANYLMRRMAGTFRPAFDRICMHEFVLDLSEFKKETGVSALDVAKTLIDYGMHPPTMYFPLIVHEALMLEPTETESRETLDEAAEIFRKLYELGYKDPEYMHAAPHHAQIGRPDEVQAARNPILRWTRA